MIQQLDLRSKPEPEPGNIELEHAVLGAVLYDNDVMSLCEGLQPRHFTEPLHGRIWAAVSEGHAKGRLVDPITLFEAFKSDPAMISMDEGAAPGFYLATMVEKSGFGGNAGEYARGIMDASLRRDLITLAQETVQEARASAGTAFDVLAGMERRASDLAHGGGFGASWLKAGSVVTRALAEARERNGDIGLSTGLHELDRMIGGLRKGQLIIIAGRPAMGKSSAGLQIAKAISRKGRGAAFFSLEMPEFDLGVRLACDVAHEPLATRYGGWPVNPEYFDVARNNVTQEQAWKLDQAADDILTWPMVIDVRPGLTVSTMAALARRQIRAWERAKIEPGCIVVDHLTIARPEQDRKGNKVAEVGDISRALAEMAKNLDIPVVALCQLSRDVEKRNEKDRRPNMSDLRWSGEIEQDARIVAFLYRPEYYLRPPEDEDDAVAQAEFFAKRDKYHNKLFWLVEKNNNGPTGQVETYCDIKCSAIRDRLGVVHG